MKKVIVITGAGGGVGSLLAIGLAAKGNHIVCLGRSEEKLIKVVDEINLKSNKFGGSASYFVVDMMQTSLVEEVADEMIAKHGKIDVWINNVGVNNHNAIGPTWELNPENWWAEVSLNLFTAFNGTRVAINQMRKNNSGYIINLGGGGVQEPKPFGSAYGAAKTALVKFTETVNIELEEEGISIKLIAFNPGFIKNERTETLVESEVARKYMPKLEQVLKYGVMSDPKKSIDFIHCFINGKLDALAGGYFMADDFEMDKIIHKAPVLRIRS